MSLTQIVEKEKSAGSAANGAYSRNEPGQYSLFSELYLEKPVMSGVHDLRLSVTACTIKGIPVIDDF